MQLPKPVVVVGIGQLGSVFAQGLLKLGHPVLPVTRDLTMAQVAAEVPHPELVLIAVAEGDLNSVLAQVPDSYKDRLVLIQNELLPYHWEAHGIEHPTACIVWFEKKAGKQVHVVIPSVIIGALQTTLLRCLKVLDIPAHCPEPSELLFELVKKNLYILVHNICGLVHPVTVGELWAQHSTLAEAVASEVLTLQYALTRETLDSARLMVELRAAVDADPAHGSAGRTAKARLHRALVQAKELGVEMPVSSGVSEQVGPLQ